MNDYFKIKWINKTNSTNSYVKNLVNKNLITDGAIIIAKEQTNGKGQTSNIWLSETNKNLTFSIYIEPKIKATNQFNISKAVAIGVYNFVSMQIPNIKIKWPNDIYVNNKKIAGILIENTIQGSLITKSIIGIGININQVKFNNSLPNPISLQNITGINYNLTEVLNELLNCIKKQLELLNFDTLLDKTYIEQLYLLNIKSTFIDQQNNSFKGTIIGINYDGRLKIKTQNSITNFGFNEIKYIL